MKTIRIYGASDDCIEVDGDFSDEGYAYDKPGTVTLSTGDVFSVVYGSADKNDATWHVEHTAVSGACTVSISRAPRDEDDDDVYSDVATVTGPFTSVAIASD